jgi:autotransporter-associated beta strand protein
MKMRHLILLFCLLGLASVPASTYTWDGSVGDLKTAHWLPGGVVWPGAGHDMVISSGVCHVLDADVDYRPQTITINQGGTLKFASTGALFTGTDATSRVITVNTGGVLELATWFKSDTQSLGRLIPDAARLVVNGGTIRMTGVTGYGRGLTVNAAGGTFEAATGADWLCHNMTDNTAWIFNGNPPLVFTGAGTGRLDKPIGGGSSVVKRGAGRWTLSRTNTYTGPTTVEEGIFTLRRASLSDAAAVTIATGASLCLRHTDGDVVGSLTLGGQLMPAGTYGRNTHPEFLSGSGTLIVGGPATVGNKPFTWFYGGGGDAAIQATLTNSMNEAADIYNSNGTFYMNVRAEYNAGVPTAQAGYGGPVTFGGSRNARVAMHELGHVFGAGTRGEWGANLAGGQFTGRRVAQLIQQIDGPGATIASDGTHFWPYGLNYDNERAGHADIAHARLVEAYWLDMGLGNGTSTISDVGDQTVAVGASTATLNVTVGDGAVAPGALILRAVSSNPTLIPASGITLGGTGAARTVRVTPAAGLSGRATIVLSVLGGRDAVQESFVVSVGPLEWNGGSGVWDTLTANWHGSSTEWPSTGTVNDAVFGPPGGSVTVAAGGVNVDDILLQADGYTFSGGLITFTNTPSINVVAGATATFATPFAGGLALAKEGAGTAVFTANSSTGSVLNINAGTLIVNANITSAEAVNVRSGGTLAGNGRFPAVTVLSGGVFSPGSASEMQATVYTEDLTLEAGASWQVDLGLTWDDAILVNGDVTLRGSISPRIAQRPALGFHTLLTYTGTLTGTPTLGAVPAGYSMVLDTSLPGAVRLYVQSGGAPAMDLVAQRSVWKYHAVVAPNLGPTWFRLSYDDASWSSGVGKIGYGDNNEGTSISTAAGKPLVAYFRKSFLLTAEEVAKTAELHAYLLRDDGAVVYLNDVEVHRENLPAPPALLGPATLAGDPIGFADEAAYSRFNIAPTLLNAGPNVISVAVYQESPASSDIAFDLRLQAIEGDADSDDDGLVDSWEFTHFGQLSAQTAVMDSDGDGFSNGVEQKARTSPTQATPPQQGLSIRLVGAKGSGSHPTLTWPSVAGVLYRIRWSRDLLSWQDLPGNYLGTGQVLTAQPQGVASSAVENGFYEVVVP